MKPGHVLFKILAILSSMVLAGGYVWYRSGGSIPYFVPAKPESPAPVSSAPNEIVVPQEVLDREEDDSIFFSGSKSGGMDFSPPPASVTNRSRGQSFSETMPYLDFEYSDLQKTAPQTREFLGGSKSRAIDFRRAQKPSPETPKFEYFDSNKIYPGQRTIISGSKSARIDFSRTADQDAAKKTEDTDSFETVIVQTETIVNGKRVLLSGSKSAFPIIVHEDDKDKPVEIKRPKIQDQREQQQKRGEPEEQ